MTPGVFSARISCGVQSVSGLDLGYYGDGLQRFFYNLGWKRYRRGLQDTFPNVFSPKTPMGIEEVGGPCTHYIFSNVSWHPGTRRIIEHIKKKELGTVTASPSSRNPNSGNYITTYIWVVEEKAFKKYFEQLEGYYMTKNGMESKIPPNSAFYTDKKNRIQEEKGNAADRTA